MSRRRGLALAVGQVGRRYHDPGPRAFSGQLCRAVGAGERVWAFERLPGNVPRLRLRRLGEANGLAQLAARLAGRNVDLLMVPAAR